MQDTMTTETANTVTRRPRKKRKSKKYLLWLVPLLVLCCVYFAGVGFFTQHFLPNTDINGQNAGGKSVKAVADVAASRGTSSTLDLTTMDGDVQQIKLSDFSYDCWFDSDLNELRGSQSPFLWPVALFGAESWNVPLAVTFDENALAEQLRALPCFADPTIREPVNAHIEKTDSGFTVVEEVYGNALDYDKVWQTVTGVLNSGELAVDLAAADCYQQPSVLSDDPGLKEQLGLWKKYEDLSITIDLTDAEEILNGDVFREWLETDGSTIYIPEDTLNKYVSWLSSKYNTFETKRSFLTTGAGSTTVGGSGLDTYGFQMSINKTTAAIQDALDNFNSGTVQAVWRIPGRCRNADNGDIGTTYIEADLARQHFWYYKNGSLQMDGDFVSGKNSEPGRRTPCGVFRVWGKQRDRILKGDDYESFVHYWMPFTWTGCGFHDAPWRGAFGGTIYLNNGSHGCLNLPSSVAANLYNVVEYDTPVIVYRSY